MSEPNEPADDKTGLNTQKTQHPPAPVPQTTASSVAIAAPLQLAEISPATSFRDAALTYFSAGFLPIPILPGTKRPSVKWDPWLAGLSHKSIIEYWTLHPDHELGVILNARILVLDADTPFGITALDILEQTHGVESKLVVNTRRGQHRYYILGNGVFAKSSSHSTEEYPERLDVKAGRSLIISPPSPNKFFALCDIQRVDDLPVVGQDFVDAVYEHNGSEPPRPVEVAPRQPRPVNGDTNRRLASLSARVALLDPDMGYSEWLTVLMAIHHETGGNEKGFDLADEWSARGTKYCGEDELRAKWESFAGYVGAEITVATLNAMLAKRGIDWMAVASDAEDPFEPCDFEALELSHIDTREAAMGAAVSSVLARYSITPKLEELRQDAIAAQYILEGIALIGQATVLYAAPNTGKTLLVIWLIIYAITQGWVDPSKVFYINCDDSLIGLLNKGAVAKAHGFHMLADGYEEFEVGKLREILLEVIKTGQAKGTVIVLDTLKKFTDLMDKRSSSQFMKLMRKFVLQGGTVIMLAHANKKPDADGKPIYAGVADILDDADGGYIMWVTSERGAAEKVVEFEVKKRRGNVRQHVTYAYGDTDDLSWEERLASVRRVDKDEAEELHNATVMRADDPIIEATRACIQEGTCKRMELYEAVARRTNCGRRNAEKLLDKYTGSDRSVHHWNYQVGPRGAKLYYLLDANPVDERPDDEPPIY